MKTKWKRYIYELFRLKTIECLRQASSVDLSEKAEKTRGFGFVTVPEFVSTQLVELNGIDFQGKTYYYVKMTL